MKNLEIKRGFYTLYNGIEYRLGASNGKTINLISNNSEDLNNGFVLYKRSSEFIPRNPNEPPMYVKRVSLFEVNDVYRVYTYAIYHGHDIAIESSTDNTVLLVSSNKMFYEQYGFEEVDRNVYMKDVPFDEVELAEERRPARYIESAKVFV